MFLMVNFPGRYPWNPLFLFFCFLCFCFRCFLFFPIFLEKNFHSFFDVSFFLKKIFFVVSIVFHFSVFSFVSLLSFFACVSLLLLFFF